jgi:MFS family permease
MPITIAAIADISEDQHKIVNMGYLQFFVSIGAFIGPILGGYFAQRFLFQELNFSMPYLIGMIIAVFTVIFAIKYFGESYKTMNCEKIVWKKFFNAKVLQISIILIFTQISWRIYYLFIPPVLQMHFHYSATVVGLFLGLIALWLAIASLFCVRWLNYYLTIAKIIKYSCYVELIGLFMSIIGSACSLGVFSQYLVWGSAIPVAMSDVVIFCALTALYSQAVSEHDQGKIMGLCFFITALVWGLVGFIGGTIMRINIALPLWCAPLGLIILFIMPFFRLLDKKHN